MRELILKTVDFTELEAHRKTIRHGKRWGKWTFDAYAAVLVYCLTPHPDGERDPFVGYEVDLEKITTGDSLCDWIFQVHLHNYDPANFLNAIYDLLNPQSTLCSGCLRGVKSTKVLDVAKHLKKTGVLEIPENT